MNYIIMQIELAYLSDSVHIVKSVNKSANRKFKNPCNSLIYKGSHFKVVVSLAPL
jgi:hypothetical protein